MAAAFTITLESVLEDLKGYYPISHLIPLPICFSRTYFVPSYHIKVVSPHQLLKNTKLIFRFQTLR